MKSLHRFRRYCPTLETLEGRCVPAVVVTSGIDLDSDGNADDLRIVGDANDNGLVISDNGATLLLDVDKNGDGDFTDPGELLDDAHTPGDGTIVLDIRLSDGNDTIEYNLTSDLNQDRRLFAIDLGSGNDFFEMPSGPGDVTNSSELIFDILAGKGGDHFGVTLPNVAGSLVAIQAAMGGGFDDIFLQPGFVDSLGAVDADFDLGGGSNECQVSVSGVGATGAGFVDVDVTGSNSATQSDLVIATFFFTTGGGGQVSNVSVDVNLLGGNDVFDGTLFLGSFNVAALGVVDLSVQGGAGNDQINFGQILSGTNHIDVGALVEVELKGGLGNDSINVDLSNTTGLEVDGEFRLRVEGNEGNDTITVNIQYVVGSTGNLDIAIYANAGNDTVTYDLEDNGATTETFGPAGVVILDGGLGSDSLDDNSDPAESDHHLFEIFV